MFGINNKHNTRLSTGVLKRKYLKEEDFNDFSSSDNDSDNSDSDTDFDDGENDNINKTVLAKDKLQYYKFLNKLFPSNYNKTQINKIKRQRLSNDDEELSEFKNDDTDDEEEEEEDKNNNDNKVFDNKEYTKLLLSDGLKNLFQNDDNNNKNINIILNLKDGKNNIINYDKPLTDNYSYNNLEDYENQYQEEEYEEEEEEDEEEGEEDNDNKNKSKKNKQNCNIIIDDTNNEQPPPISVSNKNYKKFNSILEDEQKESDYFKKKMTEKQQLNAIKKLNKIQKLSTIETPYIIHLINLNIPNSYKACALKKINLLRSMGSGFGNSEFYKVKSWVDSFIKIPFNKYNNLPISFVDGVDKCHDFMQNAKKTLDDVVYGLDDAKIQIMQLIGLWLVNPSAIGSAIGIKGPPGTGKTTLIKEGISKILNRPFELIALGGCGDSCFLDGHDYTYEGSKYGKIIDILIKAGCMNPVILFDELDKVSESPKGEEVIGVLTHLTDSTQNTNFTDKYMSEISLDMSKALYIFSYNDEKKINPILKDRMYKIETAGYKTKDKMIIAKDYLIPNVYKQAKFEKEDVVFTDEIIEYVINDFTEKEAGVRNLKRCFEIIYTKLNLYRLMKPDVNLFENSLKLKDKVTFPIKITREIVDNLINKSKDTMPYGMYN